MVQCKFPRTDKILAQSYRVHEILRRVDHILTIGVKYYDYKQGLEEPEKHKPAMTGHQLIEFLFEDFNYLLKKFDVDLD